MLRLYLVAGFDLDLETQKNRSNCVSSSLRSILGPYTQIRGLLIRPSTEGSILQVRMSVCTKIPILRVLRFRLAIGAIGAGLFNQQFRCWARGPAERKEGKKRRKGSESKGWT